MMKSRRNYEPAMSDNTLLISVEDLINRALGPDKMMRSKNSLEPSMSDNSLLITVEDLINRALGPDKCNVVHFKLIQTILHILARQMRLLEQLVEIKTADLEDIEEESKQEKGRKSSSPKKGSPTRKGKTDKDKTKDDSDKSKEEKDKAKDKPKDEKDKSKDEKDKSKDKKDKMKDEKDKAKEEKDKAKEEKDKAKYEKDKAKDEKNKMKEEKAAAKEKEKAAKEKEKAAKEKEKADKDQEKAVKGTGKAAKDGGEKKEKGKSGAASQTSISIREVERQKEKVLVVEKGSAARAAPRPERRDSIEVVTRSEFEMVQAMVRNLQQRAGPPPPPAMPDNDKLRSDIAKGSVSLTDTMEAMQLAARVRAAEQAISQMGDMLTQLASAGALPQDVTNQLQQSKSTASQLAPKRRLSAMSHKSVVIDPMLEDDDDDDDERGGGGKLGSASQAMSRFSMATSRASVSSRMSVAGPGVPGVTHPEMDEALRTLREDLMKQAQTMTNRANAVSDNANYTAKGVSDKLNVAIELSNRITFLSSMVKDYADQLSGLDTGISSQMTSFRDQMNQMNVELQAGLTQLALVNNNAETAAVLELTERYEGLDMQLGQTLHSHNGLTLFQQQLSDELRSLVECVEMLREQKADRDEVLDGLRDKADISRLAGLLTAVEFAVARAELEGRLAVCHDKFNKQETVWTTALKDLTAMTQEKAEVTQLLATCDSAEQQLRNLQEMQRRLAIILGEPKAALVMRALSKGAYCGACMVPALIEPVDPEFGTPPPLPALRGPHARPGEPCVPTWQPPAPPDHREHICNRWVGGSHTLLSAAVTRERAPPPPLLPRAPTKKYAGTGDDGRLYLMEEDLQPCVECNQVPEQGAGDQEVSMPVDDKKI